MTPESVRLLLLLLFAYVMVKEEKSGWGKGVTCNEREKTRASCVTHKSSIIHPHAPLKTVITQV